MHIYLVSICHVYVVPREVRIGVKAAGTTVTDGCEPPGMGGGPLKEQQAEPSLSPLLFY